MESRGIPLGKYVKEEIFYGIKTGLTQAFVVNSETRNKLISEDPASEEIIKPLVVGKGISKWQIKGQYSWLIVTKIGINITNYPAIFKHLQKWQSQLEKRCDKGNHWWELRPCAYYAAFDRPKIIYQTFQVKPCFTYDTQNYYPNNSVWTIPLDDLYLLGVLNSKPFWGEISRHCTPIQNGYQLIWKYLQKAIIPNASETERKAISKLVQKCLDAKGVACEAWEQEINVRVAKLYGFEENHNLN